MTRLTEDHIEAFALERLEAMRYGYAYGPTIAHDGEQPERVSYEQVVFSERLAGAVRRIDPKAAALALDQPHSFERTSTKAGASITVEKRVYL